MNNNNRYFNYFLPTPLVDYFVHNTLGVSGLESCYSNYIAHAQMLSGVRLSATTGVGCYFLLQRIFPIQG